MLVGGPHVVDLVVGAGGGDGGEGLAEGHGGEEVEAGVGGEVVLVGGVGEGGEGFAWAVGVAVSNGTRRERGRRTRRQ